MRYIIKNMKTLLKKKYEGLGFVEALIAIMVSGIVATILINIAVSSMKELIRLDVEDAQAHHARSAAVLMQNIANRERLREDGNTIVDNLSVNRCYRLNFNKETAQYDIDVSESYSQYDRDSYKVSAIITDGVNDNEGDYFRIVCMEKIKPGDTNKLLIKVIIGFNRVAGMFSNSSDIADYKYFAIINL